MGTVDEVKRRGVFVVMELGPLGSTDLLGVGFLLELRQYVLGIFAEEGSLGGFGFLVGVHKCLEYSLSFPRLITAVLT